jgi:hypothetical protein
MTTSWSSFCWDKEWSSPNLKIRSEGMTVSKVQNFDVWNAAVCTSEPCSTLQIQVDRLGKTRAIMIGFVAKKGFIETAENHSVCGYWLYTQNACLYGGHNTNNVKAHW